MERDFMGLGSKSSPIAVKEEASGSSRDSGSSRGNGTQWSLQTKVSATPQFLSFKPSQEDRTRRSYNEHLVPSSFLPTSSSDQFDSIHRSHYNSFQPFESYANRRQNFSASMNVPPPIMAPPVSVLSAPIPFVGTTDIRCAMKHAGSPAQLTIFYAGSVCVYDDISPEKAQAIMLLAGNGSSKPVPAMHVQSPVPIPRSPATFVGINSPRAVTPCAARPTISQIASQCGPSSSELPRAVNSFGAFSSCSTRTEPPKVGCSIGSAVALPQARKASLARFLEKRKDRVTSASPYSVENKFDGRTQSEARSSSVTSASPSRSTVPNLR